jgi:hypothetical protein
LHIPEDNGVAVVVIENLRLTRTIRVFVKLAPDTCRPVHRQSIRGAGSGAPRRAGGHYTEDGVSGILRGFVASGDLGQHSSAGDEAGEEKQIELHDFL